MNAETVMLVRTVQQAGQLRTGFLFKNTKSSYYSDQVIIIYINRIESE
jgi:hypothetical protein